MNTRHFDHLVGPPRISGVQISEEDLLGLPLECKIAIQYAMPWPHRILIIDFTDLLPAVVECDKDPTFVRDIAVHGSAGGGIRTKVSAATNVRFGPHLNIRDSRVPLKYLRFIPMKFYDLAHR